MTVHARESPLGVLAQRFGFSSFRPGQQQVVDALLDGRSALAVWRAGWVSGKSASLQAVL